MWQTTSLLNYKSMCMIVLSFDYNIVYGCDGCSATLLVLDASPPDLGTFAPTPLIVSVLPHHYDWVAKSSNVILVGRVV